MRDHRDNKAGFVSLEEAAAQLKLSARTIHRWARLGEIRSMFAHGRRLVALSDAADRCSKRDFGGGGA